MRPGFGYVRGNEVKHPGLARLHGPAIDVDLNPTVTDLGTSG
jgi:hypothetical protein